MQYCRLCERPCDNCSVCLRRPDRIIKSSDMIKTALEKKGAFTSSEFRTISTDPPKFSVTDRADGGNDVAVRLTSMRFIAEYRDPQSHERKKLEKAAREEIIKSFDLPRDRVSDDDIKIEIREGSVEILIVLLKAIVAIACATIAGLFFASGMAHDIKTVGAGATGAALGATAGLGGGPVGMAVGGAIGFVVGTVFGDKYFK